MGFIVWPFGEARILKYQKTTGRKGGDRRRDLEKNPGGESFYRKLKTDLLKLRGLNPFGGEKSP